MIDVVGRLGSVLLGSKWSFTVFGTGRVGSVQFGYGRVGSGRVDSIRLLTIFGKVPVDHVGFDSVVYRIRHGFGLFACVPYMVRLGFVRLCTAYGLVQVDAVVYRVPHGSGRFGCLPYTIRYGLVRYTVLYNAIAEGTSRLYRIDMGTAISPPPPAQYTGAGRVL